MILRIMKVWNSPGLFFSSVLFPGTFNFFLKNKLDIFILQLVLVLKEEKESEALFQDQEEGTRLGKWQL